MERNVIVAFATATAVAALVGLDQVSKWMAPRWDAGLVVPHRNAELALGLPAGRGGTTIAVMAAVVAGCWLACVARACIRSRAGGTVLVLFVAGTLGNGLDRVTLGYVRDWFVVGGTVWNVADVFLLIAIPAGVLIAGLHALDREEVNT